MSKARTFKTWLIRFHILVMLIVVTGRLSVAQADHSLLVMAVANSEKVYLQLDRKVYTTGSTVRFRAFLVNAELLPGGKESNVLYLELDGPLMNESRLWRANVQDGSCAGSFIMPYGLKSGMYSVRAFTSWMKNGKPEYIFSADILVLEISEKLPDALPMYEGPPPGEGILSLYPESGQWVDGIASTTGYRVNFRVNGMLPDTMQLVEDDSLIAAQIVTMDRDFGSFGFLPDIRKSYQARLIYPGGQTAVAPVPVIKAYGYTLHAEEETGGLRITVNARPEPGLAPSSLRLVAAANGSVLYDASLPAAAGGQRVFIPLGDRRQGIVNLTLYDSRRFLLCQRLCYVDQGEESPEIDIGGIETHYANGGTVEMQVRVTGLEEGDSLSMAVSVSEEGPFAGIVPSHGIEDYFTVFSEFSNASWFFSEAGRRDKQQLQDMLLCSDPEDYAWNYYAGGSRLPDCNYEQENKGYVLRGTVRRKADNEVLANAHLMINTADSGSVRMIYARTDINGSFYAVLSPFYDRKDIILQVLDPDDAEVTWELEEKRLEAAEPGTSEYVLSDMERDYIEQTMYLQIIDEVYAEDRTPEAVPVNEAGALSFLAPNQVILPADYEAMNSFREISDNILPGLRFTTRNQQFRVGIFDRTEELWLESGWVFLNGVLFRDLAYIATLGSKDIERIEIQSTKILLGKTTLQGLLSIYTVDGQVPQNYLEDQAYVFHNEVLQEERAIQMAQPAYAPVPDALAGKRAAPEQELTDIPDGIGVSGAAHPDFRQTLLWAPDVRISGRDILTLTFQTSQLDGLYRINIQGITLDGIPLQKNLYFTVQ